MATSSKIRIFEELRGRGYDGGYDAVRRYARRWAKQDGQATATAYVSSYWKCTGFSLRSRSVCDQIPHRQSLIGNAA